MMQALLALPFWTFPAVWIGSILLMFPIFYVAMLALRAIDWIEMCRDDAYGDARSIVESLLLLPLIFFGVVLAIASAYDWLINHTSAVLLFWDKAQEPLITGRLERYKNSADGMYGWRKRFANVICIKCLDWADPSGRHCK